VLDHPREIGPYRVKEILGQGGVGTVYLVEQHSPFRRLAALKLVKLGMDTREVLVRFAQERQMLALMNHPGIARVYDAGQTGEGRPYFVMEYVPGAPITDYCDQRHLNVRERLELFVQVCRAIQHAHQKGILHRDIKPSNILVAEHDGRARPVVIDFGLAKVLRSEPASAHLLTKPGQFLGTPRYMSPEQVELPSEEIDTRADVYALGVVLFELLVGAPPHERKIPEGGLHRLLLQIREEESTRPSTRLSQLAGELADVAAKRRTDRAALLKQLRGDLDWIAVMALERDRERRYSTAAELAADVERYLHDQPIAARPPSTGYRIERFVRRNRLEVAAALAVSLALVLGAGASTFWFLRASSARDELAGLVRTCETLRNDVANAHLWFEEALARDQSLSLERDVLVPLRSSLARIEELLGLEAEPAGLLALARSRPTVEKLRVLRAELVNLITITQGRWNAGDEGRAGGDLDQAYDAAYRTILAHAAEIEGELEDTAAADWRRSAQAGVLVNALGLIALAGLGLFVLRFWRRRE
jgi:serine/threonine protein kinase